jgi:hypothetical protein
MARKSKKASSKKPPKKAAKAKKWGPKKSAKPRRPSALPGTRVVVLSTITMPAALQTAFMGGYNDSGGTLTVDFVDNLGYDRPTLRAKFQQLNGDNSVALVVTVGGLVIFRVGDNQSTKKFISLVGGKPENHGTAFFGGVSLQSFRMNAMRLDHLNDLGFQKNEVGLFQNPNSDMATREANRWRGGEVRQASGNNSSGSFGNDLQLFSSGIKAVVISADPFFQKEKNALVAAANATGRYFCYPLQDYGAATPPPTPGKATLHGPDLADPYRLLGVCASLVINSGRAMNPEFLMLDEEVNDL